MQHVPNGPADDAADRPPSVDALARSLSDVALPAPLLVEAARGAIAAGDPAGARKRAEEMAAVLLRPVVNATGVLLHTNLGRAPIAVRSESRYHNLELDLLTGQRGSRHAHAAGLIARTLSAEAAIVVNNGAAAVLLVLAALAAGRPVIVSRGELVEIGGGFRIPEVLESSGARLVEVGTTNRTRRRDYEDALEEVPDAALVLKVHQSNYRIIGFTESVTVSELSGLGRPVVADIGSGLLDSSTPWLSAGPPRWLHDEPAAKQTLGAGAALVTFSCDKLFGGPQAGVIAGRADLVRECAHHPLCRALRPGALVLEALQQTALSYLRRDGTAIPFWRMATVEVSELKRRAEVIAGKCGGAARVVDCESLAGGGSLPGLGIPSAGVTVPGDATAALRTADVPVVARVVGEATLCDLRTVDPQDDLILAEALSSVGGHA